MIIEAELDKVIYTIVQDCSEVTPPLDSGEIRQIALEQLEAQISVLVDGSLSRLVAQGLLAGALKNAQGAARRYSLTDHGAA